MSPRRAPSVRIAVALYLGYLAVFFAVWAVNGVDYSRIGEDAETLRLWYALPTLAGCAVLVVAVSRLGWWGAALFEESRSGPRWVWILPVAMGLVILDNLLGVRRDGLSAALILWAVLGALGVGFGEEMATRGSMIVGLRSRFGEPMVWLVSTVSFSALHLPNMFFGLSVSAVPVQLVLTFIIGSGLYAIRRVSGTLILPMILHGLWDSSLFLGVATGSAPSASLFAVYPLSAVCVLGVLMADRKRRGAR